MLPTRPSRSHFGILLIASRAASVRWTSRFEPTTFFAKRVVDRRFYEVSAPSPGGIGILISGGPEKFAFNRIFVCGFMVRTTRYSEMP